MAAICVFCGSRPGMNASFTESAAELGRQLAIRHHTLIYGGGRVGMMGVLADAMLSHGGHVIGVIPQNLARVELMHDAVKDMRVTANMHERKALMHDLADGYITLPGGYGTMEELFEAVTWAQLELHARPIAILNDAGVYDGLVSLLDCMLSEQFLSTPCRNLLTITTCRTQLLEWVDNQFAAA